LRANGATIDPFLLEAPPTEIRQRLKRQSIEGNWLEALETAETAMALPCGRGWLDLQRQVSRACAELGSYYDPIALAVRSELRALLTDLPQLPELTMMDDTPTANAETQAWLKQILGPSPAPEASYGMETPVAEPETATGAPDPFALALDAARSGNEQEGIEILTREITNERSGRGRFHRKVQLSQLCLSMGREDIAYPILSALAGEIEQRKLDEWEASDTVAHPLALLFRCISKMDRAAAEKQKLYEWICRLDPVQALACSR
jgi:type VI secretion system protein ImpA